MFTLLLVETWMDFGFPFCSPLTPRKLGPTPEKNTRNSLKCGFPLVGSHPTQASQTGRWACFTCQFFIGGRPSRGETKGSLGRCAVRQPQGVLAGHTQTPPRIRIPATRSQATSTFPRLIWESDFVCPMMPKKNCWCDREGNEPGDSRLNKATSWMGVSRGQTPASQIGPPAERLGTLHPQKKER